MRKNTAAFVSATSFGSIIDVNWICAAATASAVASAIASAAASLAKPAWLLVETISNPLMQVSPIAAQAAQARALGMRLMVDNTFATPVFQQPFTLGADLVVHSVTKYLAGHSDLIQGAVLARDAAVFEPVRFLQNAIGAVPAPLDCWLTIRGLKTLELRVQRHAENAGRMSRSSKYCLLRGLLTREMKRSTWYLSRAIWQIRMLSSSSPVTAATTSASAAPAKRRTSTSHASPRCQRTPLASSSLP